MSVEVSARPMSGQTCLHKLCPGMAQAERTHYQCPFCLSHFLWAIAAYGRY